jgi:hypothetical protein
MIVCFERFPGNLLSLLHLEFVHLVEARCNRHNQLLILGILQSGSIVIISLVNRDGTYWRLNLNIVVFYLNLRLYHSYFPLILIHAFYFRFLRLDA